MKNLTTNVVILGHKNIGESDKLVFFYSEDLGKTKVIAKGARKLTSKFTGHLETLNFSTISLYFGPKNIILQEIQTKNSYLKNINNFEIIKTAIQIAEITDQILFEEQSLDDLLPLMRSTLKHLSKTQKPSLILTSYLIKLLDKAGHIPDFHSTSLSMEDKYMKFFHYLKTNNLEEIEKICLKDEEERKINHYTKFFSQPLFQTFLPESL